jgi:hypothetical protein
LRSSTLNKAGKISGMAEAANNDAAALTASARFIVICHCGGLAERRFL